MLYMLTRILLEMNIYDYTICIVNTTRTTDIDYLHHYVIILGHHSPLCKPSCNGKAKTDCQSYCTPGIGHTLTECTPGFSNAFNHISFIL